METILADEGSHSLRVVKPAKTLAPAATVALLLRRHYKEHNAKTIYNLGAFHLRQLDLAISSKMRMTDIVFYPLPSPYYTDQSRRTQHIPHSAMDTQWISSQPATYTYSLLAIDKRKSFAFEINTQHHQNLHSKALLVQSFGQSINYFRLIE